MVKAATLEFEFVAEIARLEAGLRQIKQGVNQTMREAVREHQKAEAAADRYAAALEKEAAAIGKTADQIKRMEIAANAAAAEQAGFVGLAQRIRAAGAQLEATGQTVTRSTGSIRAGGMQLSQNLNDVAVQWQMQTPAMTIFAQQSGQVIQAIGLMTAETKGLLGFLGGPWGVALTSALVLASPFVMKLFEGSEGAKQQAEALKAQKKAIEDLDNATGRGNKTLEQRIRLGVEATKTALGEAMALRTKLAAELASLQLTASGGRAQNYGANYASDLKLSSGDVQARIAENEAAIRDNEARLRAADRLKIMKVVAAETDKGIAITQRYESAEARLNATFDAGRMSAVEYHKQLKAITEQRNLAQTADQRAAKDLRDHNKEVREAAKQARDLAKAQRELQGLFDTLQGKFDPEGASRAEYQQQLAQIERLMAAKLLDPETAKQWASEALRQLREALGQVPTILVPEIKLDFTGLDQLVINMDGVLGKTRSLREELIALADTSQATLNNFAAAFGKGGQAISGSISALAQYAKRSKDLIDERDAAMARAGANAASTAKAEKEYAEKSAIAQISAMGDVAGAAKGFFNERSKAYKVLETAEKAYRAIELAMSVKSMVQAAAEAIAKITSRTAAAAAAGTEAMAVTAASLPFPFNLGAMGTMAAALAAIGIFVGFSGGGGGSRPQTNQGTGTVFGDSSAKSDSIKRSIDFLADLDTETLVFTRQMAASLKNIENNIGGLSNLVIRLGGVDGIGANAAAGVNTGSKSPLGGAVNGTTLGIAGGVAGAAAVSGMLSSLMLAPLGPLGFLIGGALGAIASKLPIIGDILGGIGKIFNSLFGSKTKVVGQGIFGGPQSLGSIEDLGFSGQTFADIQKKKKFLGMTTSTKYSTQFGELDDALSDQFGKLIISFADAIRASAGPLGLSLDDIDGKLASFVVDIGKIDLKGLSGDEIQEKLTAVFGAQADKMAEFAVSGLQQFQKVGEGYFETLVRVASTVDTVTNSLQLLGLSAKSLGIEASMGIADLFDSVSDYQSAAGAYFEAFYTDAEQAAAKSAQLGKVFTALGVAMPDSIAGFRSLVEAQDLTTDAGRQMYASLLQIAPAFAEVSSAGQQASTAAAILRERNDLERQLMELQGDTAAIRAAELAQLDPSNRALQEHIWALKDEADAAAVATRAAEELAAKQRAVADERAGLERQMLQLNNDTAALRALDLQNVDASNQDLMKAIWARQDQIAAEQAAQAAAAEAQRQAEQAAAEAQRQAEEAARAAQQLVDAWKSIGDGIMDEVKRIRGGLLTETASYAQLRQQFDAATAAARAGNQDAAKSLPELSRSMLEAAAATATDAMMLKRIQAVTASSLEQTYAIIAGAMGFGSLGASTVDQLATFVSGQGSSSSTGSDMAGEIRALRAQIAQMAADNAAGHATTAEKTGKVANILDRVTASTGGDSIAVSEAA